MEIFEALAGNQIAGRKRAASDEASSEEERRSGRHRPGMLSLGQQDSAMRDGQDGQLESTVEDAT